MAGECTRPSPSSSEHFPDARRCVRFEGVELWQFALQSFQIEDRAAALADHADIAAAGFRWMFEENGVARRATKGLAAGAVSSVSCHPAV
jgi:hypothetical protein